MDHLVVQLQEHWESLAAHRDSQAVATKVSILLLYLIRWYLAYSDCLVDLSLFSVSLIISCRPCFIFLKNMDFNVASH